MGSRRAAQWSFLLGSTVLGALGCQNLRLPSAPDPDPIVDVRIVVVDSLGIPAVGSSVEWSNRAYTEFDSPERYSGVERVDSQGAVAIAVRRNARFDVTIRPPCCGSQIAERVIQNLVLGARRQPWKFNLHEVDWWGRLDIEGDGFGPLSEDSYVSFYWRSPSVPGLGSDNFGVDCRFDQYGGFALDLPDAEIDVSLNWVSQDPGPSYSRLRGRYQTSFELSPEDRAPRVFDPSFVPLQIQIDFVHTGVPRASFDISAESLVQLASGVASASGQVPASTGWAGEFPVPSGPVQLALNFDRDAGIFPVRMVLDATLTPELSLEVATWRVEVRVADGSGRPLLGATDVASERTGLSLSHSRDGSGRSQFFLPSGRYTFGADALGFSSQHRTLEIDGDMQLELRMEQVP